MDKRRSLAGLWAILALAAMLLVLPALDRPDPERAGMLIATTVLVAVAAALVSLLRRLVPPAWARWALALLAGLGWGAVAWLVLGSLGPWAPLALVVALAAAWLGYLLHGAARPDLSLLLSGIPDRARVRAVRGRGVRPVVPWATEISSVTMRVIGIGLLVVLLVAAAGVGLWGNSPVGALVLVLTAVVFAGTALAWSRVEASVDAEGLRVRSRVLPVTVMTVPVEQIVGVAVEDLDPMRWGGVGLRATPDRTAFVQEGGGPGIVVHRRDGRRLALHVTEGDEVARAGARELMQAAGQRLGEGSSTS